MNKVHINIDGFSNSETILECCWRHPDSVLLANIVNNYGHSSASYINKFNRKWNSIPAKSVLTKTFGKQLDSITKDGKRYWVWSFTNYKHNCTLYCLANGSIITWEYNKNSDVVSLADLYYDVVQEILK